MHEKQRIKKRKHDGITVWTFPAKRATAVHTPFDGGYCGYGRDSRESEGAAKLSARIQAVAGAAACEPNVSVAKLALTHGIHANMLFPWRR
jgi:hypothetical protein